MGHFQMRWHYLRQIVVHMTFIVLDPINVTRWNLPLSMTIGRQYTIDCKRIDGRMKEGVFQHVMTEGAKFTEVDQLKPFTWPTEKIRLIGMLRSQSKLCRWASLTKPGRSRTGKGAGSKPITMGVIIKNVATSWAGFYEKTVAFIYII